MSQSKERSVFVLFFAVALALPTAATAQETLEDDDAFPEEAAPPTVMTDAPKTRWGVGVRGRGFFVPQGEIELFLEEVPSSVFQTGFGLDVVRRKADSEIVLGLGYDKLAPDDGFYLEKGDVPNVPGESPDYVEFDNFSWITAEVTLVWNHAFNKVFALRYGAGLGVGLVLGDIIQTDSVCTAPTTDSCTAIPGPAPMLQYKEAADVPPVFPVVNALIGTQISPFEDLSINIEAGWRTVGLFFGAQVTYFIN